MKPTRLIPCFENRAIVNNRALAAIVFGAILIIPSWSAAAPLGSKWTYQGRITDGGVPVNDTADFRFSLWDAEGTGAPPSGGSQLGTTMTITNVTVVDGVFTVQLDFGAAVFNGDERWLQIGVRSPAGAGTYTTLSPRQSLTATPYAQTALIALNAQAVPGIDGHSLDAADGNPVDALYVDDAGRVGIGTTTPADKLTISQGDLRVDRGALTTNQQAILSLNGARTGGINPFASIEFSNFDNDSSAVDYIGARILSNNADGDSDSGDLRFFTKATADANPLPRMIVGTTGNVGIGTLAPEYLLDVGGAIRATNSPIKVTDGSNNDRVVLNRNGANDVGYIQTFGPTSTNLALGFVTGTPDRGYLGVMDENGTDNVAMLVNGNDSGEVKVKGSNGSTNVWLTNVAGNADAGAISVNNSSSANRGLMYVNPLDCGDIQLYGPNGNVNVWMTNVSGSNDNGWVGVYDSTGTAQAGMYVESNGDGRIFTGVLQINGGSDLAEPFDVTADGAIEPGMVVAIDPQKTGRLRLSTTAYDHMVAGIISGAGGVNPGLMMSQKGSVASGEHPVALTGRVYCWVDADAGGAVHPGDLLTTSNTPGHAMRVTDHGRAAGAVLGKAMSSLESGRGLVLVLVSLQ